MNYSEVNSKAIIAGSYSSSQRPNHIVRFEPAVLTHIVRVTQNVSFEGLALLFRIRREPWFKSWRRGRLSWLRFCGIHQSF